MAALLKGTAFVTGAASGIGQYTAYGLAAHGVKRLAIADINPKNLQRTVDELKRRHANVDVKAIEMDVSNEESVEDGIRKTVSTFGSIDIAVNNAGIAGPTIPTPEVSVTDWSKVLSVNLTGVWICQRAEIQQMLKQYASGVRQGRGTIVNVASMYGLIGSPPHIPATAYVAAKHGVMGITKAVGSIIVLREQGLTQPQDAVMFARQGIRINAICPGYVATPLLEASTESTVMKREIEETPLGRLALMEEIADSIVFLASPMSSFMCGAGVVVDGGFTAK